MKYFKKILKKSIVSILICAPILYADIAELKVDFTEWQWKNQFESAFKVKNDYFKQEKTVIVNPEETENNFSKLAKNYGKIQTTTSSCETIPGYYYFPNTTINNFNPDKDKDISVIFNLKPQNNVDVEEFNTANFTNNSQLLNFKNNYYYSADLNKNYILSATFDEGDKKIKLDDYMKLLKDLKEKFLNNTGFYYNFKNKTLSNTNIIGSVKIPSEISIENGKTPLNTDKDLFYIRISDSNISESKSLTPTEIKGLQDDLDTIGKESDNSPAVVAAKQLDNVPSCHGIYDREADANLTCKTVNDCKLEQTSNSTLLGVDCLFDIKGETEEEKIAFTKYNSFLKKGLIKCCDNKPEAINYINKINNDLSKETNDRNAAILEKNKNAKVQSSKEIKNNSIDSKIIPPFTIYQPNKGFEKDLYHYMYSLSKLAEYMLKNMSTIDSNNKDFPYEASELNELFQIVSENTKIDEMKFTITFDKIFTVDGKLDSIQNGLDESTETICYSISYPQLVRTQIIYKINKSGENTVDVLKYLINK